MRDAENNFKPRARSVVPNNMEPIMLPGNGLITRGVTTWSGNDFEDVIDDNIQMITGSSRNTMTRRGRETSRFPSARSRQGQQYLMDSTKAGYELGSGSGESDWPLIQHAQGLQTRFDTSTKLNEGLPHNSEPQSPKKAMTAAAAPLKRDVALDNSPLPDQHPPKFINQALRDYRTSRPPFVRLCKKKDFSSSKRVTLATQDGRHPQTVIPATLMTRRWDSKFSYHTIDRNGERIIVKPFGNPAGVRYRAWSGQGNGYQRVPVAFGLKDDPEDQNSNGMDSDDDLESNLEDVVVHELDDVESEDDSPTSSRESSPENVVQQGSGLQGSTKESDLPEPPASPRPLTCLNASQDGEAARGSEVGLSIGLGTEPRAGFSTLQSRLSEASADASRIQEVTAGKRQAPDVPQDDRSSKKGRPEHVDPMINNTAIARVPPTLTTYKQERTILYVLLPGSVSDVVAIKLCSAMSISTLFSSVCSAVGIKEYVNLAIAILLEREDGASDRSMIIRQNSVEAFEIFLEAVDEAPCWSEEGGKLSLRLHLKSMVEVEMAMRV